MTSRIPLVYVAGPYRAATPWDVEKNVRRAETVAREIWQLGAAAVCPHSMNRFFDKSVPDDIALPAMLELLRRCDGVAALVPFTTSTGTLRELKEAAVLGLSIVAVTLDGSDVSFESRASLGNLIEELKAAPPRWSQEKR